MAGENGKLEELKRKFGDRKDPLDLPQPVQPTEFQLDLEKLRGPNRTEDVAKLIQQVSQSNASMGESKALREILDQLQSWAIKIDRELTLGITPQAPSDTQQLAQSTS